MFATQTHKCLPLVMCPPIKQFRLSMRLSISYLSCNQSIRVSYYQFNVKSLHPLFLRAISKYPIRSDIKVRNKEKIFTSTLEILNQSNFLRKNKICFLKPFGKMNIYLWLQFRASQLLRLLNFDYPTFE